ncbi:hypothetical protein ACFSQJ_04295 [Croceitalea marina]|uniref:Uncharacterized protein n=1 Tax=Croceitalea marina TaxID=1775166 RepID=A0ABW5MSE3_9FLAO
MKTITIFIAFLLLPIFFTGTTETNVYICKGKGSKKYHYRKSCRGLSRCSTKVFEVTLKKAKEMKRTLCGWED